MRVIKEYDLRLKPVKEKEMSAEYKVTDPTSFYDFLVREVELDLRPKEIMVAVGLNNNNNVIGYMEISRGSINKAIFDTSSVFQAAILMNATAIVLAHNHTSDRSTPSDDDIRVTENLIEAGILLNIPIIDHLVVSTKNYTSIKRDYPEIKFDIRSDCAV